jgi:hypothetical protein
MSKFKQLKRKFMKKVLVILLLVGLGYSDAKACTNATIDEIVVSINTFQEYSAGPQLRQVLSSLELCDENLYYAGYKVGSAFNPFQELATYEMANVVRNHAKSLPADLNQGLGLGLIHKLNLFQYNASIYMLNAILDLGKSKTQNAKQFALELLKRQNAYQEEANAQLLQAVQILQQYAKRSSGGGSSQQGSYWAFRSRTEDCGYEAGPWGQYELCPRYFASVSDSYGNRIVLTCKAPNAGVEFRVSFANSVWSQFAGKQIQALGFGTTGAIQSLGVPYVIHRDQTLLAEEVLAPEILGALRGGNNLDILVRMDSGESSLNLKFTLKGSNKAISELLQVCH